eukprot:TRINITY_DN13358_c0_g1_i1.p1 TRINITY_DN13358_c0_g1~~TRINITY_DN13358_c0_g1_i1.p1  ORF type:complete len:464 (+),score=99.50 TRINITY_DN13358_c0_g1_i1:56-1447(+)
MGNLDTIKAIGGIGFIVLQLGLSVYAVISVFGLKDHWLETVPESATVLTVQMKGFSGPVHVLVPTNCRRFVENDAQINKTAHVEENDDNINKSMKQESDKTARVEENDENINKSMKQESERRLVSRHQSGQPFSGAVEHSIPLPKDYDTSLGFLETTGGLVEHAKSRRARRLTDEYNGVNYDFNSTHIEVKRCDRKLYFEKSTSAQNYWAMTWLSGKDTMMELRDTRCRMLWYLAIANIISLSLNCIGDAAKKMGAAQMIPVSAGFEPLPNQENQGKPDMCTKITTAICSALGTVITKLATLQSQCSILSLFFIYWHEDFYVTSYIPGKAFLSLVGIIVCLPISTLAMMAASKTNSSLSAAIGVVTMLLTIAWFFVIYIPLVFGYGIYNFNFLWNTAMADDIEQMSFGVVQTQSDAAYLKHERVVEAEWNEKGMKDVGLELVDWIVGAHTSEIIINFVLDLVV